MFPERKDMIKNNTTDYVIKTTEEVAGYPEHQLDSLRGVIDDCVFIIPIRIRKNQHKLIYKVGFLKTVYSFIHSDFTNHEIYMIIEKDWQVFKGVRQMERLYAEYLELKKKGEI